MRLIINTEYFLQCHGHCPGCFLTTTEREESNTYLSLIESPLFELLNKHKDNNYEEIIIGFGRGNLLNLTQSNLTYLTDLIVKIENQFSHQKIKFEISTSLIGKIENMKTNAVFLLEQSKNIYFNIVINSDIISQKFWENYKNFTEFTEQIRTNWGWSDNTGDIFVININPEKLPDLNQLEYYFNNKKSPFNISLFPFTENINESKIIELNDWAIEFWHKFKHLDLNLKNFLDTFFEFGEFSEIKDLINYHNTNLSHYYFIDKHGLITNGSLSTMGEVDYPRLISKYKINPDIKNALKVMQKNQACLDCNVKTKCIATGAYITMLCNYSKLPKTNHCLNGYQKIFQDSETGCSNGCRATLQDSESNAI